MSKILIYICFLDVDKLFFLIILNGRLTRKLHNPFYLNHIDIQIFIRRKFETKQIKCWARILFSLFLALQMPLDRFTIERVNEVQSVQDQIIK